MNVKIYRGYVHLLRPAGRRQVPAVPVKTTAVRKRTAKKRCRRCAAFKTSAHHRILCERDLEPRT